MLRPKTRPRKLSVTFRYIVDLGPLGPRGPVTRWSLAEKLRLLQVKTRTLQGTPCLVNRAVNRRDRAVGIRRLFRAVKRKAGGARLLIRRSRLGSLTFNVPFGMSNIVQFSSTVVGWIWFTAFIEVVRRLLVEKFIMVTRLGLTRRLFVPRRRQLTVLRVLVKVPTQILLIG